ncbi:hypothetical protein DQ244_04200 [Blastococcus sp. TBT05-19]|nr:hypothetical protein DQ244_04200 [Blastococcus sp. TBT05-19]
MCRQELVRADLEEVPGALVGQEAHIIARSPGGPRYEPLAPKVRDGYANLILLCANDHTEVDAQPTRYTVEHLRAIKHRHEQWVAARLDGGDSVSEDGTLATLILSGDDLWPLLAGALGWQIGMPEALSDEDADLIDESMQLFTDWCDISSDVEAQGFRSVRDAKRSLTGQLNQMAAAGFVVLGGRREAALGAGVTGPVVVLEVVRPEGLEALRVSVPGGAAAPGDMR